MDSPNLFEFILPPKIYRRFLILTDVWPGTRAATGSLLIKVHDGGDKLPLYWCGTPDTLPPFYQKMGKDRSIYCLCGTFGVLPPAEETIVALGKYFTAEIIKAQPEGPYLLGGFCEAALVSYEIAKNMQAYNYKVGLLMLFDRDVTKTDYWLLLAREFFHAREKLVRRRKQFAVDPVKCIKEILFNKWQNFIVVPFKWARDFLGHSTQSSKESELPVTQYKLTTYAGNVSFIYVKWGLLGHFQLKFFQKYWDEYVQGEKDFTIIQGSVHNTPNWHAVATIIRDKIKALGY